MSAWEAFKRLPRRRQVLVLISWPLWLPIAVVSWLEDEA